MIPVSPVQRENAFLQVSINNAIRSVIESGHLILGRNVEEFEARWAKSVGAVHAVGLASGLDALEAALRAGGVKPGDRVVVPALSAAATALAPLRIGATPVFVDVDTRTGLMDIPSLLQAAPQNVSAVVHVSLYGLHASQEELRNLQASLQAPVVLDMAQGHRVVDESEGRDTGGTVSAWSFYPTKNLGAVGDAGAVTTDDEEIADWIRRWRNYGQRGRYEHVQVGVNARLDEIQAAVLDVKLDFLSQWTRRRRVNAEYLLDHIKQDRLKCLVGAQELSRHALHQFVVAPDDRELFRSHMAARGISTDVHYPTALPDQVSLAEFESRPIPAARSLASRVVSLPVHPFLSEGELEQIATALHDWCTL